MQLTVFAGVVERNVGVGAFVVVIHFAHVERLRIDVDADCPLVEFGKIEHLVHRFEWVDVGRVSGVHLVDFGGSEMTGAVGRVAIVDAEILHFQTADRRVHPTVLVAMVVNAAELADFPANGHTLEDLVLEDEIARIAALREEKIFPE